MSDEIKVRRATAAAWAAANPVLADGEFGYEKDTRLLRFGDGVTAWNALPPVSTTVRPGEILAYAVLAGGSTAYSNTTAAAMNAGYSVTFTVPPTGRVMVDLDAWFMHSANSRVNLGYREGTTQLRTFEAWNPGSTTNPGFSRPARLFHTGLTPGQVKTWHPTLHVESGTATLWGGSTCTVVALP